MIELEFELIVFDFVVVVLFGGLILFKLKDVVVVFGILYGMLYVLMKEGGIVYIKVGLGKYIL